MASRTSVAVSSMRLVTIGTRRVILRGFRCSAVLYHPSDIESFNKKKKEYLFGHNFSSVDEVATRSDPTLVTDTGDIHQRLAQIHAQAAQHPSLEGLDPSTADYKYQFLQLVRQEQDKLNNDYKRRFEFNERIKGLGVGLGLLLLAIGGHQVFMNYEYLKNSMMHGFWYEVDHKSHPAPNRKTTKYQTERVQQQLTDEFVAGLRSSSEPGVYFFGAINGRALPTRLGFFDGKKVDDVAVSLDFAAVISKGKLYQWTPNMKTPVETRLPFSVTKCFLTDNYVFFFTSKGKVAYTSRVDSKLAVEPKTRSWFGTNKFAFVPFDLASGEKLTDVSLGKSHLLALTDKGRLFTGVTEQQANYGQYGVPELSPFAKEGATFGQFETTDMPLLNNEVLHQRDQTFLRPRAFTSIACGDYHSLALDDAGHVWSWGKNTNAQCGKDPSYEAELQPIPSRIGVSKSTLQGGNISKIFASGSTSFFQVTNDDNVHLLAFGDGVKGQLGLGRFLHVCSVPQPVKVIGSLNEFSEKENQVVGIGVKDIAMGSTHTFITLDNFGEEKDVLAFGDNEYGQLGNGKRYRSSKPINLPLLVEPEEVKSGTRTEQAARLAKRFNELSSKRLQLRENQHIRAGEDSSVIFYQ